MIERGTGRPAGRRAALGLILLAGLGAWAGAIGGAPALASGESGGEDSGAPSGTQSSPTSTSNCPSPNPPNQLTLVAGTPQTTTLDTAFAGGLQVALANSDGCAVTGAAGVAVTFSAPTGGASGRFSSSNSSTATVGADASGTVAAPTFAANGTAGNYTVTASSPYGSVSFALTNTATGLPARLTAIPLKHRSTRVGGHFSQPLQVRVLDAEGNPVAGVAVTFALGSASAGGCGATASAGAATGTTASADFAGGGTQATATSGARGIATSPALTATTAAGSFTATASVSGSGGAGATEGASKDGDPDVAPVGFSLVNLAGAPAKVAPGVGSTQSTPAGNAFPIRLAVTVTDADSNPVRGALVTFFAPTAGASGRFTFHSRDKHDHAAHLSYSRMVKVRTGACGIAVAPSFTASGEPGGYVVQASAEPARPAAFALVNEAPGQVL
jgi:protocatechuate 3,4-dioxygenase beta subunit